MVVSSNQGNFQKKYLNQTNVKSNLTLHIGDMNGVINIFEF